jgi:transcriptional regulator with XRE-family HTH domain
MSLIKHNIGPSIKKLRKLKGITQVQLAKKIDSDASYISSLENGRHPPTLRMLKKISNKLEVPIAFILILGLDEDCFRKKHKTKFNAINQSLQSIISNIHKEN